MAPYLRDWAARLAQRTTNHMLTAMRQLLLALCVTACGGKADGSAYVMTGGGAANNAGVGGGPGSTNGGTLNGAGASSLSTNWSTSAFVVSNAGSSTEAETVDASAPVPCVTLDALRQADAGSCGNLLLLLV